jgi:hypothetical protein
VAVAHETPAVPGSSNNKANTQGDYLVRWYTGGWWFPGPLGDNKLDRLEALFLLRIMPIAHTDETVAVLLE